MSFLHKKISKGKNRNLLVSLSIFLVLLPSGLGKALAAVAIGNLIGFGFNKMRSTK